MLQECGERIFVNLRHLQSRRLARRRMIFLSRQGIAETQNQPISFRRIPCEFSVRSHLVRQVNDISQWHGIFQRSHRRMVHHVRWRSETGFLLYMIDACSGEKPYLWSTWRLLVIYNPEVGCRRCRYIDGLP